MTYSHIDSPNRQRKMLLLSPGRYTLKLRGRSPFGDLSTRTLKVTVLSEAIQHGWSSNGSWFIVKPDKLETLPHYILPVRKYKCRSKTGFWIGFIVEIEQGWNT